MLEIVYNTANSNITYIPACILTALICGLFLILARNKINLDLGQFNLRKFQLYLLILVIITLMILGSNTFNIILGILSITFLLVDIKNKTSNKFLYFLFSLLRILTISIGCVVIQLIIDTLDFNWADNYSSEVITASSLIQHKTEYLLLTILIHSLIVSILCIIFGHNTGCNLAVVGVVLVNIINNIVTQARGTSLQWCDISAALTALDVSSGYKLNPTNGWISAILFSILLIILNSKCRNISTDTGTNKVINTRVIPVIFSIISIMCLTNYNSSDELRDVCITNKGFYESNYGLAINLYSGYIYSNIEKPINYRSQLVLEESNSEFQNVYSSGENTSLYERLPNIQFYDSLDFLDSTELNQPDNVICIMAEALCYIEDYGVVDTTEEVTPFLKSLVSDPNTITGYTVSSSGAAGTANCEFEALTGCSMEGFDTYIYPYISLINSEFPSIVNNFKSSGYFTQAIHNCNKFNYNRVNAYNYLGFDKTIFDDSTEINSTNTIAGYVKDSEGLEYINKHICNTHEKTFNWYVTVQCHGDYINRLNNEDWEKHDLKNYELISTSDIDITKSRYSIKYSRYKEYLALLNDFDKSIEEFIKGIPDTEKTLVIIFGDHRFGYDIEPDEFNPFADFSGRLTPLIIWSNYEMPNIPDNKQLVIGQNYLGSLVCKLANVGLTAQNKTLLNMYEAMPAITVDGYLTSGLDIANNCNNLNTTNIIDISRAITYDAIEGNNKDFFWKVGDN